MQDEDGLTDAESLRRTVAGDVAAFERLVDRHERVLLRVLRQLTSDEAAAMDALQETLLAAWRGAASFRGDGSARAWLLGIARHSARRQYRRRAGQPGRSESLDTLAEAAGFGADTRLLERLEAREIVNAAFAVLDDEDRAVLLLRDVEGWSGEETAAALGIGLAAMKSRLHRARLRFMAAARSME